MESDEMSIKKIMTVLPYFIISWAVRNRGAHGEFHATDKDGNEVVEPLRVMHVQGGEFIAFSEHVQLEHEEKLKQKSEQKEIKRQKKTKDKAIKIVRDLNYNDDLREEVTKSLNIIIRRQ